MESPLLNNSEQQNVEVTIDTDSSSSVTYKQTSHDAVPPYRFTSVRDLIELFVTLVQISAALIVLILTKDEQQPQKVYVTLIIGYTCGCIATFPILCWRIWPYSPSAISHTRMNDFLEQLKKMIEYFFVGWVVVLFWHLIDNSSSLDYTTQHLRLCLAFLAISCILHVFPNFSCAVLCFFFPLVLRLAQVFDFMDTVEDATTYVAFAIFAIGLVLACICGIIQYLWR